MDIRTAAIEILSKAIEGDDVNEIISQYVSQFSNIQERINLKMIVQSALEKSKYDGRDNDSPADIANNAKRKANNIEGGLNTGVSSMPHVKEYGGSGPSAAARSAARDRIKSSKNPTNKICPNTGNVIDVIHSSGKKKNKTVFSSDEEREAHIAELNEAKKSNSELDYLHEILKKARSRIGSAPVKPATLPSEKEGINFNSIKGVEDLTDHHHSMGAMPEDHKDRQKVVDYITHLHRNGKGSEALRLYENHIKGGSGTYTAGVKKADDKDEMAKIAEMMNVVQGKDDHNNSPSTASEKMNTIGGREDAIK